MKNAVSLFLCFVLLFTLCCCSSDKKGKSNVNVCSASTGAEINSLEKLYEGRNVYYGEMHDHSDSGGTSDGHFTLSQWKALMPTLGLDFAAILDHKQVLHMYSGDWDTAVFIGGTEAGSASIDKNGLHYNMVFAEPEGLLKVLNDFPEFGYSGGTDGHFIYPNFTRARFEELVNAVKENGGYFVLPHPMAKGNSFPASSDPDCFWYGDYTGLEVLYQSTTGQYTKDCYKLWCKLLEKGRRVYACAGGDGHNKPDNKALTTVYAKEKNAAAILSAAKTGDSTAGGVGIRMAVGNTVTGGHTRFADNEKLIIAVGDFQRFAYKNNIKYSIKIYKNEEKIADLPLSTAQTNYFTVDLDNKANYYRAVVYEANGASKTNIAYGNPIWNDK